MGPKSLQEILKIAKPRKKHGVSFSVFNVKSLSKIEIWETDNLNQPRLWFSCYSIYPAYCPNSELQHHTSCTSLFRHIFHQIISVISALSVKNMEVVYVKRVHWRGGWKISWCPCKTAVQCWVSFYEDSLLKYSIPPPVLCILHSCFICLCIGTLQKTNTKQSGLENLTLTSFEELGLFWCREKWLRRNIKI